MGCPFKYLMQTFIVMLVMSLIQKYFFSGDSRTVNNGRNIEKKEKDYLEKKQNITDCDDMKVKTC